MSAPPILQFGTGRFLQAHADLFVSQALPLGQALGGIAVVQSTDSEQSSARLAALSGAGGYPVCVRGLRQGRPVDEEVRVHSVHAAWHAGRDWPQLLDAMATQVQVIVSNTADKGYELDPDDTAALLATPTAVPRSFPAKLVVLLLHRWRRLPTAPLTLLPCELISRNGQTLRELVAGLAGSWGAPPAFIAYLRQHCVWLNSLVDRIVSEPLHPAGAIAEPYALWAIERQPRMVLPCTHPAIVLTDDLEHFERRKLWLLNLAHSYLAECWLVEGRRPDETVLDAMNDGALRARLEALWREEVLPVFDALGQRDDALAYLVDLRERLLNPFLAHRLADIAQNHAQKKLRRFAPVIEAAASLRLGIVQARLRSALQTFTA
ncbi:MAG: mannitol dehydrogenase family protein [Piscinibacter sp.]|nr:mannitol dehydrogenase family protein [Piscinibacter sp.]